MCLPVCARVPALNSGGGARNQLLLERYLVLNSVQQSPRKANRDLCFCLRCLPTFAVSSTFHQVYDCRLTVRASWIPRPTRLS